MASQSLNIRISVGRAISALSKVQKRVEGLSGAFRSLNGIRPGSAITSLGRVATATGKVNTTIGTTARRVDKTTRSFSRSASVLGGYADRIAGVSRSFAGMTFPGAGRLRALSAGLALYVLRADRAGVASRLLGTALGTAGGHLAAFAFVGVLSGLTAFISKTFEAITVVQSFRNSMTAVTGSAGAADRSLEFIRKTSNELGLSFTSSVQGFRAFIVSAKLSGVAVNEAQGAYKKMSQVLTVLHANSSVTKRTFLALEQMFSKGKVSSEELRRQLGDAIPGAFNIFAESMGVTSGALDGMLRAGSVGIENIIPFIDLLASKFKGGLSEALRSPITAFGRLGNVLEQLQVRIGQGFFTPFSLGIRALTTAIAGSGITALAQTISGTLGAAFGVAAAALTVLVAAVNLLAAPLVPMLSAISNVSKAVFGAVDAFTEWTKSFFGVTDSVEKIAGPLTTAERGFNAVKESLVNVVGLGATAALLIGGRAGIGEALALGAVGAINFAKSMAPMSASMLKASLISQTTGLHLKKNQGYFGALRLATAGYSAALATGIAEAGGFAAASALLGDKIKATGKRYVVSAKKALTFSGSMSSVGANAAGAGSKIAGFGRAMLNIATVGGVVTSALKGLWRLIARNPFVAAGTAIVGIGTALWNAFGPAAQAAEKVKGLRVTVRTLRAETDIAGGSIEEFGKKLLTLEGFQAPDFIGAYANFTGKTLESEKSTKKLLKSLLAVTSGMTKTKKEAKALAKKYGGLIAITEGLAGGTDAFKESLKAEIELIDRVRTSMDARILQLAVEIKKKKELGVSVTEEIRNAQALLQASNALGSARAVKAITLAGVDDSVSGLEQAADQMERIGGLRPMVRNLIANEDLEKIGDLGARLEDTTDSMRALDSQKLSEVEAATGSFVDSAVSGFADVVASIGDAIAALFTWNNTTADKKTVGGSATTDAGNAADSVPEFGGGGLIPSFAKGTPNTNGNVSRIATGGDGGFPAILHKGEAVVPLPDGRSIPVKMNFPNAGSNTSQTSSPNGQQPSSAGGETNSAQRPVNVNISIMAQDAASFNRSQNQIYQDLQRNVTRAVRTIRN